MKKETYKASKQMIMNYLKMKQVMCFRRNIIRDFVAVGFKKTRIIQTLRQMRKDKIIKLGMGRWGL